MQPYRLKLFPESDLLKWVREYSFANNLYDYISGVFGNLRAVCFQCPGNQEINKIEGNLKIVFLNGHFNTGDLHLHLSFEDERFYVFEVHLEEGCIVKKGTEILLNSFKKIVNISYQGLISNELLIKAYILKNCPWSKRAIRLLNFLSILMKLI